MFTYPLLMLQNLLFVLFVFICWVCFGENTLPISWDVLLVQRDGIVFSWGDFSGDILWETLPTSWINEETSSWEYLSWLNQLSSFVYIQEIFPKDTEHFPEYLWLTFINDFSGTVRIVWLGNWSAEKSIEVQVLSWHTIFITDTISKITTLNQQIYQLSSITLTDNGESLEVLIDWVVQDKIIYTQSSPTQALSCWPEKTETWYRTCSSFVSPSLQSTFSPSFPDIASWTTSTWWEIWTWFSTFSWNTTFSWEEETPVSILPFRIEEIYPYTDLFPEYIEIVSMEKYIWWLIIWWAGQWSSSKTIHIETMPWIRRILTNDTTKFSFYPFVVWVPWLSLTNNWEQINLFLPNWQQIDSVVYSWPVIGKSLSFSQYDSFIPSASRGVYRETIPTPWYEREMITHHFLEETSLPVCGIDWQHSTTLTSDKKLNVQAVVNWVGLQNSSTTYLCERIFSWSEIEVYSWCNPSYIQFEPWLWPVTLRISKNNTPLCELTQELNLPAPVSTKTPTASDMSYYEWLYRKRKEKYELIAKQIRSKWYTISLQGELKWWEKVENSIPTLPQELLVTWRWPPLFVIHSVLPNPKGKDALGERLVLENISDETIYSDELMVTKGKSSKWLSWWIAFPPWKLVELLGDIWLPNTPTCIGLRFRKTTEPIALFCYPQLAEDEIYTWWMVWFERTEEQERLRDLSLVFTHTESCVQIWWQEVLCKKLPYAVDEAKQRKVDAKKLVSVTKKVVTLQEKYNLRREKYATLSKNNKKREAALTLRNRQLREDLSLQKNQKSMFYNLYWLLRKKIGDERKPLLGSPTMQQLTFLYDKLVFFKDTPMMDIWPIHMSPDEVDAWFELYFEGKLPTEYTTTNDVVTYLTSWIDETKKLFWLLFK